MLKQIKDLSKLELYNLYGLNVFRFSKDKQAKRKTIFLMVTWGVLILMLLGYVGGLSFGFVQLGLEAVIPAYLIAISSLIMLFLGIFKAGNVIFRKESYDILCSLPVSQTAVVVSRFLRMYVENLMLALLIMVPGMAVYAIFVRPSISFYLIGIVTIFFIPIAPIAIATFIGALITGISSRMKHKSLVGAGLSCLLLVGILLGSSELSMVGDSITVEMLKELSGQILAMIGKLYPPAVWLGNAMTTGNFALCLMCVVGFLAVLVVVVTLVAVNFHSICRGLFRTSAKHDYQMKGLKKDSTLVTLYKKECRRYFASGVYVTNTIVGPIMAVLLSAMLLFVEFDSLEQVLPITLNIKGMIPFGFAGIFGMMTTTSTSISMEGKEWWIVKSLPLTTKTILDSKILLNLSLLLPFYVVSEILLILALKPSILELFWLVVVPPIMILFTCVFGITVNLHFPVFNWENETTVVKQSASATVGGLGGFVIVMLCAVPVALTPEKFTHLLRAGLCVIFLIVTAFLYRKNNTVNLKEL